MAETLRTTDGVEVKAGDRVWGAYLNPSNEVSSSEVYFDGKTHFTLLNGPPFSTKQAAIQYRIAQLREELSRLEALLEPS